MAVLLGVKKVVWMAGKRVDKLALMLKVALLVEQMVVGKA